jgi:hypothetical protein
VRFNEPTWRAIGISVQGTSHRTAGLPCQDAHICRSLSTGETILAVADGAGSAACAAEGAAGAVVSFTEAIAERLGRGRPGDAAGWRMLVQMGYESAQVAVRRLASAAQRPVRDYATTLTGVVLAAGWLATGQLGDGLIVAGVPGPQPANGTGAGDGLILLARPQRGEYANEAYFLTQDDALDYVEIGAWESSVAAVGASTDGLLRLALRLPGYEPHEPFFRPLFAYLAGNGNDNAVRNGLLNFLNSARLCARTDDDKTLVLAVQRGGWASQAGGAVLLAGPAEVSTALDMGLDDWWDYPA